MEKVKVEKGQCTFYTEVPLLETIQKRANKDRAGNISAQITYMLRRAEKLLKKEEEILANSQVN